MSPLSEWAVAIASDASASKDQLALAWGHAQDLAYAPQVNCSPEQLQRIRRCGRDLLDTLRKRDFRL